MATFLFDKIIFGPVQSRRLGVSLGINLLPTGSKLCSFDCIYCECGWNPDPRKVKAKLPSRKQVADELEKKLREMSEAGKRPDVITFAGNGEPTMHPEFAGIVDDTIVLRDSFSPGARIAVLSNSTMLFKNPVVKALKKIDDNILKLDSAFSGTIKIMDQPVGRFDLNRLVEHLIEFEGHIIIQTMFLKGNYKGKSFDNTTDKEVYAWIKLLRKIKPDRVMIYTIARDTPAQNLETISLSVLEKIANTVRNETGLTVEVSG
ncbi:MAG TPA: radical SAM protein [Prolixibacteraceae bacterium]|nr:radical SAM protein [Prolixibacteraceae bacterium]